MVRGTMQQLQPMRLETEGSWAWCWQHRWVTEGQPSAHAAAPAAAAAAAASAHPSLPAPCRDDMMATVAAVLSSGRRSPAVAAAQLLTGILQVCGPRAPWLAARQPPDPLWRAPLQATVPATTSQATSIAACACRSPSPSPAAATSTCGSAQWRPSMRACAP